MNKHKARNIVRDMIKSIPNEMEHDQEVWCSMDVFKALDCKVFNGFRILTSDLLPKKEYAFITKDRLFWK